MKPGFVDSRNGNTLVGAVNTDGRYGHWQYALINERAAVVGLLDQASLGNGGATAPIGDAP